MSSIERVYVHSVSFEEVQVNTAEGKEPRSLCKMRVAVNRSRKLDNGEYDSSKSFWLDVELWGYRAEVLKQQLKPGVRGVIEGRYIGESWEDQNSGEQRYSTKFVANAFYYEPSSIESVTFVKNSNGSNETPAESETGTE